MHADVCADVYTCVKARGQSRVKLQLFPTLLFLTQGFSLNVELTILAKLASEL